MPATAAKRVGLWLDQAGATVALWKGDHSDPSVWRVESGVESHYRFSGGRKAGTQPQEIARENRVDRRRAQQLDRYYRKLVQMIGDSSQILILGPGEAKLGLERALKKRGSSSSRLLTVKTADKMTENQLVAEVKKCFRARDVPDHGRR